MKHYLAQPWYVKPTFWARWGPRALISRALGMSVPGDDGDKYFPGDYAFDEIGPETSKGRDAGEMDGMRERLTRKDRGGCPF